MDMRDYYAVLEVDVGATAVQIRRAYQRLARRYSPDVNFGEPSAPALFQEIAEAYRILSDPIARTLYDRDGARAAGRPDRDPQPASRAGRRGGDAHVPVELSFAQALSGVEADVPVDRLTPCGACRATGAAAGAQPTVCSHCGGLGTVWTDQSREGATCPACDGAGARVAVACPACRGRGVAPHRAVVHVLLPPGLDTGSQLRIPGDGHSGPFGGPRGDLIVVARVHEDPRYTRKGDNLYCEVSLSLVEAVLGSRVRVRGLDGPVELAIPPGTQSGQTFRLRGKGVPRLSGDGRGDLYVTARVEIPRSLDARTQELFRELGRLLPGRPDLDAPGGARE
jgi:molecular chaperone DnaJ